MIYYKQNPTPNILNDRNRYHQSFEYMFCFSKGKPTKFNPITLSCSRAGEPRSGAFRNDGKDVLEKVGKTLIKDTKVANNVFQYKIGSCNTTSYMKAFKHPAVFPERLACDQIASWTDVGDTVLDPMCGSGTTVFCARMLGRNAIGIDISQEYIELTESRLNEQQVPSWFKKKVDG